MKINFTFLIVCFIALSFLVPLVDNLGSYAVALVQDGISIEQIILSLIGIVIILSLLFFGVYRFYQKFFPETFSTEKEPTQDV